jgi:hypothetical protein
MMYPKPHILYSSQPLLVWKISLHGGTKSFMRKYNKIPSCLLSVHELRKDSCFWDGNLKRFFVSIPHTVSVPVLFQVLSFRFRVLKRRKQESPKFPFLTWNTVSRSSQGALVSVLFAEHKFPGCRKWVPVPYTEQEFHPSW